MQHKNIAGEGVTCRTLTITCAADAAVFGMEDLLHCLPSPSPPRAATTTV